MATEEIITRYIAEVDGYLKEIEKLKAEIRTIITEEKKQTEESKKQTVTLKQAASERDKLLESEVATLKRLKAESKLAYSPVEIQKYNTSIAATQRNIDLLKNKTSELTGVQSLLKGAISGIGAGIAAAFSVGAIKSFADGAIQAFREAEVNAKKLQFAIEKIGGEAPKAFEELIRQSEELQNITIFSDDDVQRTQTQLSQFGLVSDEIKKLTPLITELAAASGKSLSEATDLVIQGINGQTRALKPLGLEFKNTGDKAENFAIITEKLNKFVGSNADLLETDAGKAANLANKFDDLKESLGGFISQTPFVRGLQNALIDLFDSQQKQSEDLFNKSSLGKSINENKAIVEEFKKSSTEQRIAIIENIKATVAEANTRIQSTKATKEQIKSDTDLIKQKARLLQTIKQVQEAEANPVKSNLGLTEDEAAKREAETEARRQKAIDAEKKAREKAAQEILIAEKNISKLKLDLIEDEEQKLIASAEREKENIVGTEQQKATQIYLIKENLLKQLLKLDKKRSDAASASALQDITNEANSGDAAGRAELSERLRIEAQSQERINQQRIDKEREGSIAQLTVRKEILGQMRDEELANIDRTITDEEDAANQKYAINKKYADDINELDDEIKRHQKENLEKSVQTTIQFADIAMKYYQQQSDARIEALEKQGDAQTEAFDKEMEGLQNLRDKKLISESTFEARSAEIKEQRVASEKRVEAAIAAEKRKSAQVAKTLAAFKASLALLVAIAEENYIGAAIAAVELAAIIATPIPAFKHGTKGKKTSGTALVGEEGAEFVHLPQGAQVVPHKQTVKNKELVNAMIDDKVDYYIFKNYTLPELLKSGTIERPLQVRSAMSDSFVKTEKNKTILKIQIADDITKNFIGEIAKTYHQIIIKQQSENERQQQKNFNSVIKNAITSTVINNGNGMDEYAMARAINSSGMRIKNVREIGKAIASEIVNVNDYRHL